MEARFRCYGFSPHRHDTYALGVTLHGVQTFSYRGEKRFSGPGNVILLHPDEIHDGGAGTEDGLIYRMLYLPPELIGATDGHRSPLPFAPDPVVTDADLLTALDDLLCDLDHELDDLAIDDAIVKLASGLCRQAKSIPKAMTKCALSAVLQVRDFLIAHSDENIRSEVLEAVSGLDRFELARQFRFATGTSPHRYLIMRRLDRAKPKLAAGHSLAEVAAETGFADQAHFTRHFRAAFGITPGRWVKLQDNDPNSTRS